MSKGNLSKIDNLGRVVIPKSIKKALNIEHNDEISMFVEGEITIVIGPSKNDKKIDLDIDSAVKILLDQKVPKREIAKSLAFVTDESVNELYEKIKDL